jgi:hypothetical protein
MVLTYNDHQLRDMYTLFGIEIAFLQNLRVFLDALWEFIGRTSYILGPRNLDI